MVARHFGNPMPSLLPSPAAVMMVRIFKMELAGREKSLRCLVMPKFTDFVGDKYPVPDEKFDSTDYFAQAVWNLAWKLPVISHGIDVRERGKHWVNVLDESATFAESIYRWAHTLEVDIPKSEKMQQCVVHEIRVLAQTLNFELYSCDEIDIKQARRLVFLCTSAIISSGIDSICVVGELKYSPVKFCDEAFADFLIDIREGVPA